MKSHLSVSVKRSHFGDAICFYCVYGHKYGETKHKCLVTTEHQVERDDRDAAVGHLCFIPQRFMSIKNGPLSSDIKNCGIFKDWKLEVNGPQGLMPLDR